MTSPRIRTVIINSAAPERLLSFWAAVLEVESAGTEAGITWLKPGTAGGIGLGVQSVSRATTNPGEIHLDIEVDDLDAAQARIESLGGRVGAVNRLPDGFEWRVMADPDGNEFCIFAA